MRYFVNINNPEELKKAFRAYCVTMHPDKGGDAEEFKAMFNEYEQAAKNCGASTKETRETLDEWQEILRKCKHTTQKTELRVGDYVFVCSYEKPGNLSDFWGCLVDYCGEESDHKPEVGRIEAIINMTDEEVVTFDFFNDVPSGAGQGGTCGPYYDNEPDPLRGIHRDYKHEHYVTNYTLIKTPTIYFFIDCESCQYTRVFAISEDFREMPQYKAIKARKEREEAERKAAEEEAVRKAAEAMRAQVAEWSGVLERVPVAPDYNSSKGEKSAYVAAVKRNIKAVFAHYFPGVKVSIVMSSRGWDAETTLKWEDGPTLDEVEAVAEWSFFAANVYQSDPYADFGDYVEIDATHVWREAYGESYQMMKFERSLSAAAEAEALRVIVENVPVFAGCADVNEARVTDNAQLSALFRACYPNAPKWFQDMTDEERKEYKKYRRLENIFLSVYTFNSSDKVYLSELKKLMRKYYTVSADVAAQNKTEADAPHFVPKHNEAYRKVKKALGSLLFAAYLGNGKYKELTILEVAEILKAGQKIKLVKRGEYEGEMHLYGVNVGGYKVQQKRAEKFAAVGFIIECVRNVYKDVEFSAVSAEVLAELRKDAESVEAQRKAWEAAQREGETAHKATDEPKPGKAQEQAAEAESTDTTDEAPAEGLQLMEIAEGVAVVGNSRTTYRNRKAIKAHGATWNKEAQQWQATDPETVARLRAWFGVADTSTAEEDDTANESEPRGEHTHTTKSDKNAVELSAEALAVASLCGMLADMFRALKDATQAAEAEARRTADKARRASEAEQLRADMAAMREQIQAISERLQRMAQHLAELDSEPGTAEGSAA